MARIEGQVRGIARMIEDDRYCVDVLDQVELTAGGLCPLHQRNHDRARGTTTRRGYGNQHQLATAEALDGATHCWKCGQQFTDDNPATGGHVIDRRAGGTTADGTRAECRRCNYGRRPPPEESLGQHLPRRQTTIT